MTGLTPSARKKPTETEAPSRRSGSPRPVRFMLPPVMAPTSAKERFRSRRSQKFACEKDARAHPRSGNAGKICRTRSGSGNGSGARSTVFTTLNIAVLAPIPSVSVTSATAGRAARGAGT
jgi:hypothetical protein